MKTYMPSELYIYVIDNELQRRDGSIFCVQHFVFFRAWQNKIS